MKIRAWQTVAGIAVASLLVGLIAAQGDLGGDDSDTGGATASVGESDAGAGSAGAGFDTAQSRRALSAAPEQLTADMAYADDSGAGGSRPGGSLGPPTGDGTGRIIKSASLQIEVADGRFHESMREGRAVAQRYSGFVVSTSVDGRGADRGGFVIRVPARSFEAALSDLEGMGKVRSEYVSGQDVTEEFVDLEARLRNFEAQEAVLLRLMDRAASVEDTIRVQRELSGVQLEIERLRGRLRFLEDQTSLSTINVEISERGAVPAGASIIGRAWTRAVDGFLSVVSATIVGAGYVIPLLALAALALTAGRRLLARPAP